jgi:hypothetical protein
MDLCLLPTVPRALCKWNRLLSNGRKWAVRTDDTPWSEALATDPEVPALPDFLRSSGSAQPREYNGELLGRRNSGSGLESREYGHKDPLCWPRNTLDPQVSTNFADKRRSLGRYGSICVHCSLLNFMGRSSSATLAEMHFIVSQHAWTWYSCSKSPMLDLKPKSGTGTSTRRSGQERLFCFGKSARTSLASCPSRQIAATGTGMSRAYRIRWEAGFWAVQRRGVLRIASSGCSEALSGYGACTCCKQNLVTTFWWRNDCVTI